MNSNRRYRIFLKSGITPGVTEETLRVFYERFGPVCDAYIPRDNSGNLKGFAFVSFKDGESLSRALATDTHNIAGHVIPVGRADPRPGDAGRPASVPSRYPQREVMKSEPPEPRFRGDRFVNDCLPYHGAQHRGAEYVEQRPQPVYNDVVQPALSRSPYAGGGRLGPPLHEDIAFSVGGRQYLGGSSSVSGMGLGHHNGYAAVVGHQLVDGRLGDGLGGGMGTGMSTGLSRERLQSGYMQQPLAPIAGPVGISRGDYLGSSRGDYLGSSRGDYPVASRGGYRIIEDVGAGIPYREPIRQPYREPIRQPYREPIRQPSYGTVDGKGHRIFVGGVPDEIREKDMRDHFSKYGTVEDVYFPMDKQIMKRRGFCFVRFESLVAAEAAVARSPRTIAGFDIGEIKVAEPRANEGGSAGGAVRRDPRGPAYRPY